MNTPTMTAPTVTPTETPAATTTNSEAAWLSLINDPDIVGSAQTKGWDKLPPHEAFAQAMKSYRHAERQLGTPADQLMRLPTREDDEAGWRSVYTRLGAPDKPEGYEFKGLDFDDPDMTDRFQQAIRQTAAEMHMPKAMAERMAQSFHKFVSDAGERTQTEHAANLQGEKERLSQEWGDHNSARFRANMFIADQAAEKLGVTPEALTKLKDGLGASDVAKLFHRIGVAMGEDKYVAGSNPSTPGVMSREQAVARKNEIMNDPQWVDRYLKGGAPEKREMLGLNTLITGA